MTATIGQARIDVCSFIIDFIIDEF